MSVNMARERFIRLAEARVIKCIKSIRLVRNLSNKSNYKYEPEDVQKIIQALEREVKAVKSSFESTGPNDEVNFRL